MQIPTTEQAEPALRELATLIAESPHNLVSRGDRPELYATHIRECAAYAALLPFQPGQRWVDVGTGGGLPGLVLAVLRPDISWLLVDSVRKKAEAVRQFTEALNLTNVQVSGLRAEELAHDKAYRAQFDGAVSRAVAALPTLLELLSGFVRQGGTVVSAKGPRWQEELEAAQGAMQVLGLGATQTIPVPAATRPTWLVMMQRHGNLPRTLPRRSGLPRTHPLGGPIA